MEHEKVPHILPLPRRSHKSDSQFYFLRMVQHHVHYEVVLWHKRSEMICALVTELPVRRVKNVGGDTD